MKSEHALFLEAVSGLDEVVANSLHSISESVAGQVQEVRLTASMPPKIMINGQLRETGLSPVTKKQLNDSLFTLCRGSIHSHQRELAEGYLSLEGGHRAGFAATAVYSQNGKLTGFRDVNSIVLRIARNFDGVSLPLISKVFSDGLCGLIIAGPPASGKTTVLKDMADKLSTGAVKGCERVVVIDERGELSGCEKCMTLRGYDKAGGMLIAVKNLSPQVMLCDEISDEAQADAVRQALDGGVYVITAVHAEGREQLCRRPASKTLIKSGAFERIALLSSRPSPGSVKEVLCCDELVL